MKKSVCALFVCAALIAAPAAITAEETAAQSPWSFSLVTDAAYYPKSNYIAGGDHFAPLTGAYAGLEARETGHAVYTLPVPFGDNPLVKGNTLVFDGALELSPIYLEPQFTVTFTPVAFLNFSAGAITGTAWDFSPIGMMGAGVYNTSTASYDEITPLSMFYSRYWASGTFQFDVAALAPGDWHHVVTVFTYKTYYESLTAGDTDMTGKMWYWGAGGEKANGWQYSATGILGYQMPLKVNMVGLMAEFTGHYSASDYSTTLYPGWDGDFMDINLDALMNIAFSSKDSLIITARVKNRRSYTTAHTSSDAEPLLTCSGNEWYFNRIAFRYTHKF